LSIARALGADDASLEAWIARLPSIPTGALFG
jgi:hypothetical protein